ncbi:hypothetical protein B0T16DRAFT_388302 [Cercophora newfieldiana]|uniref:Uncharacterized protein n=1 Tax=Cercophora newfieldiana TaxID=92897 RepID=A0AA39YKD6_9PEZI|nr:hypothetical protein B0T16DRAFT_388302 [Cercophora newfieldiana]
MATPTSTITRPLRPAGTLAAPSLRQPQHQPKAQEGKSENPSSTSSHLTWPRGHNSTRVNSSRIRSRGWTEEEYAKITERMNQTIAKIQKREARKRKMQRFKDEMKKEALSCLCALAFSGSVLWFMADGWGRINDSH